MQHTQLLSNFRAAEPGRGFKGARCHSSDMATFWTGRTVAVIVVLTVLASVGGEPAGSLAVELAGSAVAVSVMVYIAWRVYHFGRGLRSTGADA